MAEESEDEYDGEYYPNKDYGNHEDAFKKREPELHAEYGSWDEYVAQNKHLDCPKIQELRDAYMKDLRRFERRKKIYFLKNPTASKESIAALKRVRVARGQQSAKKKRAKLDEDDSMFQLEAAETAANEKFETYTAVKGIYALEIKLGELKKKHALDVEEIEAKKKDLYRTAIKLLTKKT